MTQKLFTDKTATVMLLSGWIGSILNALLQVAPDKSFPEYYSTYPIVLAVVYFGVRAIRFVVMH